MKHPLPEEIRVRSGRAALGLVYGGETFDLPAEFLRVYSPSAQVRGHGPGQEVLQTGKKDVLINDIEPVGQYALKIVFSDGLRPSEKDGAIKLILPLPHFRSTKHACVRRSAVNHMAHNFSRLFLP